MDFDERKEEMKLSKRLEKNYSKTTTKEILRLYDQ
jgi:hypothetical protein